MLLTGRFFPFLSSPFFLMVLKIICYCSLQGEYKKNTEVLQIQYLFMMVLVFVIYIRTWVATYKGDVCKRRIPISIQIIFLIRF